MYFLCNRVRIPDKYYWGNIVRVIRYIIGNPHLSLIIRADSLSVIKWWVNVYFATHPDCKGHTGAMMYIVPGRKIEILRKQKINGTISMEAEIVIVDDALPQCLWSKLFIWVQGYALEDLKFHKETMSAILMENNGK